MIFLGTCAADGLPNPFCECPLCEDARLHPENGRMRSCFLLDEKNLIDCGPDISAECTYAGVKLANLENLFITHTHEDHFDPSNAGLLSMSMTRKGKPLDIYMSEEAYNATLAKFNALTIAELAESDACVDFSKGLIRLHSITPGKPYEVGEYTVTAIPTTHRVSHREHAVNYVFEKDGQRILYACDTGYYPANSLEMLKNADLDILIMECTWGNLTDKDTASHLNCEAFLIQLERLESCGAISDKTRIYATHINHKHSLTHPMIQKWFDDRSKYKVIVASDGMRI